MYVRHSDATGGGIVHDTKHVFRSGLPTVLMVPWSGELTYGGYCLHADFRRGYHR